MGKTIRKIGAKYAPAPENGYEDPKNNQKLKLPIIEGKAFAAAHEIDRPYNCRCSDCTGKAKQKKTQKIIEKLDQTDLEDFLSDMHGFN